MINKKLRGMQWLYLIDAKLHVLYVATEAGISIFEENGRNLCWLGDYTFGVSVHSLMVDEEMHDLYLPLPRMGGRAVLRILHASQTLILS